MRIPSILALLVLAFPSPAADISLRMTRPAPADLTACAMRAGVPFARGELTDKDAVRLFCGTTELPLQTEVMATWGPPDSPDGRSIKWLGLDFVQPNLKTGVAPEYRLTIGDRTRAPDNPVTVEETPSAIRLRNGPLDIVINRAGFNLFESVKADGKQILSRPMPGAYMRDERGRTYWACKDPRAAVTVEARGPLAAVVRAEGWFVNPDDGNRTPVAGEPSQRPVGGFGRFITRIYVTQGQPAVRVQHTFILTEDSPKTRYGDIGIVFPIDKDAAVQFGGTGAPARVAAHLLQKSADRFDFIRTGEEAVSGARAEGWVQAGPLALAVKDFWQNYPKEIEFDPAASTLTLCFWPRHGVERVETIPAVGPLNGWQLPFVHTGRLLDFAVPPDFLDKKTFGQEAGYLGSGQSVEQGMRANALGIAKTHEILIAFGDREFDARRKHFQSAVHVLPDPRHIAGTRVLGHIAAADTVDFPDFEARLERGLLFYTRMLSHAGSYGMWNYGDVHHKWLTRGEVWGPSYYRLWGGFHHGKPRLFWWAYLRSGNPDLLDFGRAELQHMADIDLCHWSNAAAAKGDPNSNRKMVGGLCDYKGFVHWNAGDRACYNSLIDVFLYDFYLTGNRRSRDAALEHGYYVFANAGADQGRTAAGQVDTLVNLYQATWDPKVGERMRQRAHVMMSRPPYAQHATFWTPWLWRYWETTQDPVAREYILNWAEAGFMDRAGDPKLKAVREAMLAKKETWYGPFPEDGLDITAYAYYITGDSKYADYCRERLRYRSSFTFLKDGDLLDGWNGQDWYEWAFSVRDGMIALEAARKGKLTMDDLPAGGWINIITPRLDNASGQRVIGKDYPLPANAPSQRFTTVFYHDGAARQIPLGTRSQYNTTVAKLSSPAGALLKEFTTEGRKSAVESVAFGPEQPKGFYTVTHESPWSFAPALPAVEKSWMRVGPGVTWCVGRGRAFFFVPPDCARFELTFAPGYEVKPTQYRYMGAGVVYDPDLRVVAPIASGNEKCQVISVDVPPAQRGKVWSFVANDYVMLIGVRGIPSWVSASHRAFAGPNPLPPDDMASTPK